MKKLFLAVLAVLVLASAMSAVSFADEEDPTITAINILDADAQLIEICFSEPVNCANLGYIIPVEAFPNGDHAWANLEWNGHYEYYGCVDADGNLIGEGEESYCCVDGDQTTIFAERMVVTVGLVQNFGVFDDLTGIEFKDFNGMPGGFSTPDGRKMKATDASGSLFVPFSTSETTEPVEDVTSAPEETAKPDVTEKPDETDKPVETRKPDVTEKTDGTEKTEETPSAETTGKTEEKNEKNEKKPFPVLPVVIGAVAAAAVIAAVVILVKKKK